MYFFESFVNKRSPASRVPNVDSSYTVQICSLFIRPGRVRISQKGKKSETDPPIGNPPPTPSPAPFLPSCVLFTTVFFRDPRAFCRFPLGNVIWGSGATEEHACVTRIRCVTESRGHARWKTRRFKRVGGAGGGWRSETVLRRSGRKLLAGTQTED